MLLKVLMAVNLNYINSQPLNVEISVFEPLPSIELAAFIFSNSLSGSPRFFAVDITPQGIDVIMDVQIKWNKAVGSQFYELISFSTYPFKSGIYYNDDLGSRVLINTIQSNSELIKENLNKGVAIGNYEIFVKVYEAQNPQSNISSAGASLEFTNPSQILTIYSPERGSIQDLGNVVAEWDNIPGVSNYIVLANARSDPRQSMEEALSSGNPIINNRSTGLSSLVNLRELLDREWLPGQEIILQIKAEIPSPNGNKEIFSDPINFYLSDSDPANINRLSGILIELLKILLEESNQNLYDILTEGRLGELKSVSLDGRNISESELIELLNHLISNKENLLQIYFTEE